MFSEALTPTLALDIDGKIYAIEGGALWSFDIDLYGYFNNHYAGHAPGSIALLREIWRQRLNPADPC